MIRRELPDGTMLLIPQEDHADVSAQFAAHWGNADFSTPNPYQSVVFATVYHDSGHREVEAATPVDVELGTLFGMRDMPGGLQTRGRQPGERQMGGGAGPVRGATCGDASGGIAQAALRHGPIAARRLRRGADDR